MPKGISSFRKGGFCMTWKKKFLFILCSVLAVLASGCRREEQQPPKQPEETIELTEEEERILCELYVDEERIREGKLYGYQETCLEQLRFAMDYLEEKYPDKDFTILAIHPKSKINMRTTVEFYELGDTENYHNLFIEPDADGWVGEDDFEG